MHKCLWWDFLPPFCCCGYTSVLSHCCFHGDTMFFFPPLPFVFSVIQPPLPLPIDKVRIQTLCWCSSRTLTRALTAVHVVELSADGGTHRLLAGHAAATLQKANIDPRGRFYASILATTCAKDARLSYVWKPSKQPTAPLFGPSSSFPACSPTSLTLPCSIGVVNNAPMCLLGATAKTVPSNDFSFLLSFFFTLGWKFCDNFSYRA